MKIAIVVGTRPEIIKMAPVIREIQQRQLDFIIIHSNQHYSENMDAIFFKELDLPAPQYNLGVGSGGHSNQTGNILIKIEPILEKERPDIVLAQGDTNTVMAAALAAHKLGIKVGHIEAGLRSYDKTMPEESNRIITDHISDFLFAVTQNQYEILAKEGIPKEKIFLVGNSIVDAVLQNKDLASQNSTILSKLNLTPREYCLFTAHRVSNVDSKSSLQEVLSIIESIPYPVCWPIHLRALKKINEYKLTLPKNVIQSEPLGYLDFLQLEQNAKLIVTDSGGLQEEACILGVPCITIRENTERPETVEVGANQIVGRDLQKFKQALKNLPSQWVNPFGDGTTSSQICDIIARSAYFKKTEKITVVGMGYMGLPTALLFANRGFDVEGFDIIESKVKLLNEGKCPFDEVGLPELLGKAINKNRFKATNQISPSDIFIIAVPTPHIDGRCDLSYVIKAAESIATVAKDGDIVIVESTIKPRTCSDYVVPIFHKMNLNVHVAHCPERAIPGETLKELIANDRIIGTSNAAVGTKIKELYSTFVNGEIFITDTTTAEAVKLMENTFRDVNIALANEFSILADELGFDVWEAIKLANRHPRVNILSPGPGVGGHCIAIDPWFLTEDTQEARLIPLARRINDGMPERVVERLISKLDNSLKSQNIAVLGIAYKKNVDDARETPAEHIYQHLIGKGFAVKAHDPFVAEWQYPIEKNLEKLLAWADAAILVTDHDEYKNLQLDKIFLDTRNLF